MGFEINTLVDGDKLSSEQYHGMEGTYSSSQLKAMLQDPEVFYRKYIAKTEPREENSAFAVGTYFHTSVLEPHKLEKECAVYEGATRRGEAWEKFQQTHKGKAIVNKTEKALAEKLTAAVKESPISMGFLNNSKPEVSAFIQIYVMGDEVFSFRGDKCFNLTSHGWVPTSLEYDEEDIKDFGFKLVLKVRADALGQGDGVISDLKSTSGNAKKAFEMQSKVSSYQYDLSAALYLDVFTMASGEEYHTFVWIFASKDVGNSASWKASDKSIMVGRAKWKYAVVQLAKYMQNGWNLPDELGTLEAPTYAVEEWLK